MLRVPAQPGLSFRARARVLFLRVAVASCAALCLLPPSGASVTAPGSRISNTALCRYLPSSGSGSPEGLSVESNAAVTTVAPLVTFEGVVLSVAPQGAVPPGAALTYTLVAENRAGIPLTSVAVRLPLEPDLASPVSISGSPGAVPQPSATEYDPGTRTVTWRFAQVPVGGRVSVQVVVPVGPEVTLDSLVEETGSLVAAESPQVVSSNTVVTPIVPPALEIVKRAGRSAAAPGDPVPFTLEVRNAGDFVVSNAQAVDTLPDGLAYVRGSGRVDGAPSEPEVSADGRTLRFALGTLGPGDRRVVNLAVRVTATAREGDVTNRAQGAAVSPGGHEFESGGSSATVRIVPGPFAREAVIAGRVFVDDDGDGLSDPGEPGVPGVLVSLEDGRGAVTDITGRWHVEGVRPGLHVARLDRDTLPGALAPQIMNADWVGDRGSRFVETRPSGLAVADLPVGPGGAARCLFAADDVSLAVPESTLLAESGDFRSSTDLHLERASQLLVERGVRQPGRIRVTCDGEGRGAGAAELERVLRERLSARIAEFTPDPGSERGPGGAPPDGGPEKDGNHQPPTADGSVDRPAAFGSSGGTESQRRARLTEPLEQVVRNAPVRATILFPADGERAPGSTIAVEVVYPADSVPELRVDGVVVPADRIGATSTLASRAVSASRYIGVRLRDGANRLEFRAVPAGARAEDIPPVVAMVTAPGSVAGLRLSIPESHWIADAVTPGVLLVEAIDASGLRVAESPLVTIDVDGSRPVGPDADPDTPGWQVLLDDGAAVVKLAPRSVPGRSHVRAATRTVETESFVDVLPAGGRWRIVGLAEARVAGDGGVEGDGGGPPGFDDDPLDTGGRLAFTARGPVGASARATVSVDTARERDRDRLDRYFEPDRFFPIYGDASTPVDEASRQGPVFARIDGPIGFAQYGDVSTGLERTELSRYDRRLEGASGRATLGRTTVEGFAASTEQTVVRDVFAPDGTSGPYLLSAHPVVSRSERVVLELRDRERTDEVLLRQEKLADLDYDLDAEAGTILFRGPVPPFDAGMNSYRIVVTYETRGGGSSQIAAGARVSFRPGSRVETGLSAIREERQGDDLSIYGADLTWRPGPGTTVRAEAAATDEGAGAETATRVEVRSRPNGKIGWELAWRDLPTGFANPTLLGAPEIGSRRLGGSVLWEPSRDWRVKGEAFRQEQDDATGVERTVAGLDAERRFARWSLFGGLKSVGSDGPSGPVRSALAEAGVRGKLATRLFGEAAHRQVLGSETAPGYPTRTSAGIAWEFSDGRRLVLRHELESGDGPTHDRTSLGVEGRVGSNSRAWTRYELSGGTAASIRSMTGVETVLPLRRGASVNLFASAVDTSKGSDDGDFTTAGAGYEKRFGDALLSGRYEINLAKRETRHVGTFAGAFRVGEPWKFFARERLFVNQPDGGGSVSAAEGLLGAAYRPMGRAWQALVRLDHTSRGGTPTTSGGVVAGGVPSEPGSAGAPAVRPPGEPGVGTLYDRGFESPDSVALNVAAGAQATAKQRVALTGIVRRVAALDSLGVDGTTTYLLGAHYTAQILPRWTLGGSVRRFAQQGTDTATFGAGVEVGWLAIRNLWLTGGYNAFGFREPWASAANEGTEKGFFLSVRFKFDEGSIENLRDLRLDRK